MSISVCLGGDMSRQYYLKKKSVDASQSADITSTGDEHEMITILVTRVFEDLAVLLMGGHIDVTEAIDIVRGLDRIDKHALEQLTLVHHSVRVSLIDELYEIKVVNI